MHHPLSLIAAVLLAAGCGQTAREKPAPEPPATPSKKSPAPTPKPVPDGKAPKDGTRSKPSGPDFVLSSPAFVEDFKKDAKAAHARYDGKTVEVTGKVITVNVNVAGEPVVTLDGPAGGFDWVQCFTRDRYPARSAAPGQIVTVKGKGRPASPGAALADCEIVRAEGPKPAVYAADALSSEYAKGGSDKHEGKWLALSGVIERVEFDEDKAARVVLKTKEKPRVVARFTGLDEKLTRTLKPGQQLRVLGEYKDNTSKDEVALAACVLLEAPK